PELRPVNDAAGERADAADLVVLVEALEKVDDQLAVGARESQSAPSGDPAVCRDESERIPEARGPLGCRHGRSAPPVEMRRHMRHVTLLTMSRRRARDPRIVLRAPTLRPALTFTRRHASICTDTEVRDKPSIWSIPRSIWSARFSGVRPAPRCVGDRRAAHADGVAPWAACS